MRLIKSIVVGTVFMLGLGMSTAYAGCTRLNSDPVRLDMNLGRVVVNPDVPVGGIIASKKWSFDGAPANYKCTRGKYNFIAKIVSDGVDVGNKVYSTNIPGIGLRMIRTGSVSMTYPSVFTISPSKTTNYSLANSTFTLEVVKTAEVTGTGTLKAGVYSTYDLEQGTRPVLITELSGSSITIISPSCNVLSGTNMDINMGEISKNNFTGVGTSGGERNFDIRLQCNGGTTLVGYSNINMSFSGKVPGTLSNNSGVLENEASSNTKAKGIGIQVMKDSQPIKFDNKYKIATLQSDETRFITVPLQAKFYQYEKNISAGQVESHMVFNLNYD